jgi:uncharacterized protein (TIGR03435 family)
VNGCADTGETGFPQKRNFYYGTVCTMTYRTLLAVFLICVTSFAQAPPAFEVASVKRDVSGGNGGGTRVSRGGIFSASNSTLQALIRYAYGVKDYQIQGPGWMGTERYDIEAKARSDRSSRDIELMLQGLLGERFGLKIRREVRQMPVYALVVANGGSKLPESKPADSSAVTSSNHSIVANKVSVKTLATLLAGQMDRPVLDSTGIEGTFDVSLEWTADSDGAAGGASVFSALTEQLGLRLESQSGPVEIILVDHAEKVPTEN